MKTLITTALVAFAFFACRNTTNTSVKADLKTSTSNVKSTDMNTYVTLFEIPATDISRAIKFYESILAIEIERIEFPEMEMGILPYENQNITGIIVKSKDNKPSSDGITIYLNGGDNLQTILNKVEINGGKVILPKTAHADENGYFALFLDTEGNRLGLNSPN